MPARIAMMAITTSNSIKVKPRFREITQQPCADQTQASTASDLRVSQAARELQRPRGAQTAVDRLPPCA
jgi:hypothetical protein